MDRVEQSEWEMASLAVIYNFERRHIYMFYASTSVLGIWVAVTATSE